MEAKIEQKHISLLSEWLDPMTDQEIKEAKYAAAFEQVFGTISPTQTWGFSQTATTRSAQPNSNQWGTNDWDGRYLNYPKPAQYPCLCPPLQPTQSLSAPSHTPPGSQR